MSNLKMTGTVSVVLALAGLLLIACQPTVTSQLTPEAQPVVDAGESPTATPPPTDTPVPRIPTDTLSPEPSPMPTLTPTTIPPTEPPPTPDAGRGVAYEIRSIEEVSVSGPPQIVDIVVMDPFRMANGFAIPISTPRMGLFPPPPDADPAFGWYRSWADELVVHEDAHLVHMLRPSRNKLMH